MRTIRQGVLLAAVVGAVQCGGAVPRRSLGWTGACTVLVFFRGGWLVRQRVGRLLPRRLRQQQRRGHLQSRSLCSLRTGFLY